MRFVRVYLAGYFLLVLGALVALWYGGVLQQLPLVWVAVGLVMAAGLGLMLAVAAGKPAVPRE